MGMEEDSNGRVMLSRLGQFRLPIAALKEPYLQDMFGWLRFIPLRMEHQYDKGDFLYIGTSPHFEEVSEGVITPEYNILIHIDEDANRTYEVKEC